ncbi:MAG: hypothetical protein E6K13_07460 [Methanobacteriota archaeon]|nr:MAG: hypothetical protein E6K13_07460 [Euryarchaeota archaeon]
MIANEEWHRKHPLGRNASLNDRVRWHVDHTENCGCRPIPESVKRALRRRGVHPEVSLQM